MSIITENFRPFFQPRSHCWPDGSENLGPDSAPRSLAHLHGPKDSPKAMIDDQALYMRGLIAFLQQVGQLGARLPAVPDRIPQNHQPLALPQGQEHSPGGPQSLVGTGRHSLRHPQRSLLP